MYPAVCPPYSQHVVAVLLLVTLGAQMASCFGTLGPQHLPPAYWGVPPMSSYRAGTNTFPAPGPSFGASFGAPSASYSVPSATYTAPGAPAMEPSNSTPASTSSKEECPAHCCKNVKSPLIQQPFVSTIFAPLIAKSVSVFFNDEILDTNFY